MTSASAQEYYQGKTIRFVVGFAAGGGYDTYTRAIARHLGKHIPGNPSIIVENLDGAGSLIAAHYMYRNADPDGLTIGVWNSAMVLRQALGDRAVRFDARRFGWVGAPSVGLPTCAMMGFTGMRTTARAMLDEDGDDKFVPFLTHGDSEDREVKDLPRLVDTVRNKAGEKGAAMINAYLQQYDFQRPLTVAPYTPRNTLAALRKAFKATLGDPEVLQDAKKSKLDITYVAAQKIDKLVSKILGISQMTKASVGFEVRGTKKEISKKLPDVRDKLQFLVKTQARTS